MRKLLIQNGCLLSPVDGYHCVIGDILIENGLIKQIDSKITDTEAEIINAEGCYVTPGLIDIHVHAFPNVGSGIDPDRVGIDCGTLTVFDAGTSGAKNYKQFRTEFIEPATTRVYTLLNVSGEGLLHKPELDDMHKINEEAISSICAEYPENIVGLKARASASVVGDLGLLPIARAAEIAHKIHKPLMVHVGNYPPALSEVLDLLDKGDIITHAYHGKEGGILEADGSIIEAALKARQRGVLFDVGHGVASFSFKTFKQAMIDGFEPDFISTDLHSRNIDGPVFSLISVMNKILNCGETLEQVVTKVTSAPADHFQLSGLGHLSVNSFGDISLLKSVCCDELVEDAQKETLRLQTKLIPVASISSKFGETKVFKY